jgi:signal transduction histidine kinase
VEIKDNGSGIDEADMPHIFNPFFTRKNYGTGLGLSLVKKIVDLHQGKIEIISEKDKGTKVCVTLPSNERRHIPRD